MFLKRSRFNIIISLVFDYSLHSSSSNQRITAEIQEVWGESNKSQAVVKMQILYYMCRSLTKTTRSLYVALAVGSVPYCKITRSATERDRGRGKEAWAPTDATDRERAFCIPLRAKNGYTFLFWIFIHIQIQRVII